jgi:hypothetical protein
MEINGRADRFYRHTRKDSETIYKMTIFVKVGR